MQNVERILQEIGSRQNQGRLVVAICGAPGAGKSTLATAVCDALNVRQPGFAEVMPMDGYHLDNALLDKRGLRVRKGAPQTFDTAALTRDLTLLRAGDRSVILPVFDRDLDVSRASAREVATDVRVILVEGNYLLLDQAPWSDLALLFDLTVFLDVPEDELERRLIRRWLDQRHSPEAAKTRALGNDIPNARLVCHASRAADIVLRQEPGGALT